MLNSNSKLNSKINEVIKMKVYKYIGENPLDFICNGVPSHLHYNMIVKPSLVKYMLERHPKKLVIDDAENRKQQKPNTPTKSRVSNEPYIKNLAEEVNPDFDEELLNEIFFDKKNTKEDKKLDVNKTRKKEGFSVDIDDDIIEDESFEDIYNEIASKESSNSKIDLSKLTTHKQVLNLFPPELTDVCTKLNLSKKGSKTVLVNRICESLGIKK